MTYGQGHGRNEHLNTVTTRSLKRKLRLVSRAENILISERIVQNTAEKMYSHKKRSTADYLDVKTKTDVTSRYRSNDAYLYNYRRANRSVNVNQKCPSEW